MSIVQGREDSVNDLFLLPVQIARFRRNHPGNVAVCKKGHKSVTRESNQSMSQTRAGSKAGGRGQTRVSYSYVFHAEDSRTDPAVLEI